MKHLFSLLLAIMCVAGCYEAIVSTNTNDFVLASTAMCLSAICFLIHSKYPLKKYY